MKFFASNTDVIVCILFITSPNTMSILYCSHVSLLLELSFMCDFTTKGLASYSCFIIFCPHNSAPPPFRPGNPALCGSRPLVTPYYCRLGDLLCFVFMSACYMFDLSVYYLFLQYFDTVGWVFWPVKSLPDLLSAPSLLIFLQVLNE